MRNGTSRPLFSSQRAGLNHLSRRRGVTLIEMLVATAIMMVAVVGMVAVWAQMMRTTLTSDNRGSAYEVAKQVMERSRSIGFYRSLPPAVSHPVNSQGNTNLTAPMLARWRFFDAGLKEIVINPYDDVASATNRPNAPVGARFCVLTTIAYTDTATGNIPPDRPDLEMLAIQVTVFDARYPNDAALYTMQDALTTGGV